MYDSIKSKNKTEFALFPAYLLNLNVMSVNNDVSDIIDDSEIDFEKIYKERLKALVTEIENRKVEVIEDDYMVKVNIKDPSVYAFEERKQIR